MNSVYIGLGSNIEPRKSYLDNAIKLLAAHEFVKLIKVSSIYETDPVDYVDQDQFLNLVVLVESSLDSQQLLVICQKIEARLNRKRIIDKGPRTIDLDILLFNNEEINETGLTIPHPRLHQRAFVIIPLNEIAPDVILPTVDCDISELSKQLSESDINSVRKWDETTDYDKIEPIN